MCLARSYENAHRRMQTKHNDDTQRFKEVLVKIDVLGEHFTCTDQVKKIDLK